MFELKNTTPLRQGIIKTKNGDVKTPFFMPDATRGFIKSISSKELDSIDMGPMVVNTFHLLLQPGIENIKKAKGVHRFMNWDKPLLSDSGGFQIFSLIHRNPEMGNILDDKVVFKSPLSGERYELTPERAINIQFDLGVDMMVCLDDCPPNDCPKKEMKKSVDRTILWAERCKKEYEKQIKKRKIRKEYKPLLFAVIQGGTDLKLREYCAKKLIKIGFPGYGFGAMPVDKNGNFLDEVLEFTANLIPEDALRFALGIGTPEDIQKCVSFGWDMFDCVIPTREGRHGRLFQKKKNKSFKDKGFYKTININNAKFIKDFSPINSDSKIEELRNYSLSYLHHLFKLKEPLGQRLASLNNLEFYMDMMRGFRGK